MCTQETIWETSRLWADHIPTLVFDEIMSCTDYCSCWELFHLWALNLADGFVSQLVCPTTANSTGCAIFMKNDLRDYKGRRELVHLGSCDWAHAGEFSCFPGWLFAILVIGCILAEAYTRLVIPWLIWWSLDWLIDWLLWWPSLRQMKHPKYRDCFKKHSPLCWATLAKWIVFSLTTIHFARVKR